MSNKNTYKSKFPFSPLLIIGILLCLSSFFYYNSQNESPEINEQQLKFFLQKGQVKEVILVQDQRYVKVVIKEKALGKGYHRKLVSQDNSGYQSENPYYTMRIASVSIFDEHYQAILKSLPHGRRISYKVEESTDMFGDLSGWTVLLLLLFLLFLFLRFAMRGLIDSSGGRGLFGINKSKATLWGEEHKVKVKLTDVAGMVEEKEEIKEFIDCLKKPDQITKLGGRIPKGVLLAGPPGTGKTLLAKAVAGEAGVPFFSVSGSDFVEIFVGVGASRVGDLFEDARKNAPCIIFIDEIDAIGGSRNNRRIGGNEERETTLNKLLAEMDGFNSDHNIVIIGATNRVEVLDSALLRPGRFDRQIMIGLPGIKDREAIFKYHIKKTRIKVGSKIDLPKLAIQTPGFSGADIANTCNEAALLAARKGKKNIDMSDFQEAMDRVSIGLEKKSKVISPKEKEIVAWHEAGHAVASWYLEHASPLVKVSIIPRGHSALGYAQYRPKEQVIYQVPQLLDTICVLLAARVAEEMTFGTISTGAGDDLRRSTRLAYDMITKYGMNKEVGHVCFDQYDEYSLTTPYSQATSEKIDEGVRKVIAKEYERATNILNARKEELKKLAEALLDKEVLHTDDVKALIGPRPFEEEEDKKSPSSKTKLIGPAAKGKRKKS